MCQEDFLVDIDEEQQDFDDARDWEIEVNTWTLESEEVYDRDLIIREINFVPDWAFDIRYTARKWEDPDNFVLYMCGDCFFKYHPNDVAHVWLEEGLVDPFNLLDIYENNSLWCEYCDNTLFKFVDL